MRDNKRESKSLRERERESQSERERERGLEGEREREREGGECVCVREKESPTIINIYL